MVVNHGVLTPITRLADASLEEWRKLYDINLFSGLALVSPSDQSLARTLTEAPQAKAAIPELKKTKGCVVWVSSGAALSAYTAWGAYGSSKAALNSLSAHLAVEEPDITSVCIGPGRVDTDMQKVLREEGKAAMAEKDHTSFVAAFEGGELFKPEQPGNVVARLVVDPQSFLSGKYFKYAHNLTKACSKAKLLTASRFQAPELAEYQE
jgi:NAD(P)-dependent dehydrogenase (short-subunit alcohol dehydrogenase family)